MGLYSILVKPIVRKMDIEDASRVALSYFRLIEHIPGGRLISRWIHGNRPVGLQREVFGLNFYNTHEQMKTLSKALHEIDQIQA